MNTPEDASTLQWRTTPWGELSLDDVHDFMALRQEVFIVEQDCPYVDIDGLDKGAWHLRGTRDGQLLAYLRCLPPGTVWPAAALGRIVVSPAARGMDLGREVVRRGLSECEARWPGAGIEIGAQTYLLKFYGELGFDPVGEEYMEDGIPHIHMVYRGASAET